MQEKKIDKEKQVLESKITIDSNSHNQRFDRFLRKYFKEDKSIGLTQIYRWIRQGDVLVNGKKKAEDYRLLNKDLITFSQQVKSSGNKTIPVKDKKQFLIKKIDNNLVKNWVIFENTQRLVFNKPSGISIHPSENNGGTLCMQDYLDAYIPESKDGTFKPSFGYRLDKETSGVLIAGKTYDSLQYINEIIRNREIDKFYTAVVVGVFPKYLKINKPLRKSFSRSFGRGKTSIAKIEDDDAKESLTECWLQKVIYHPVLGPISLIKVHIETGRMHQIRVHVADAGFPVIGDIIYGMPRINRLLFTQIKIKKQFLHCLSYSFWDKFEEEKRIFEAPLPDYFELLLAK